MKQSSQFLNPDEREAQQELQALMERRRSRFRILVCVDGSEASYEGLRFAAEVGHSDECDIILLHVRPFDAGLSSGGLQLRVTRENMLEWGLEIPGIQYLKKGLDLLIEAGHMQEEWDATSTHTAVAGDPLGDNKIEYTHDSGKSIVLKLKTATDAVSGILDQYELGPYNLIILGAPTRWQGDLRSFWNPSVAQKVAMLAPCSTMVSRRRRGNGGYLICVDGSENSLDAARRAGVLARQTGTPISLLSVARRTLDRKNARARVARARADLMDIGLDVRSAKIRSGDPVRKIIEFGRDYELIVVSDSGKSPLKRFVVGSVAFGVMGRAATSVLNVR